MLGSSEGRNVPDVTVTRHVCLWIHKNAQILRIRDHLLNITRRIVCVSITELDTCVRQTAISGPQQREALCIVYMPMEDVEVVLVEQG